MKVDFLGRLPWDAPDAPPLEYVATIGSFDGVHKGHQFLVKALVERAQSLRMKSLVVTFEPLPFEVLHPEAEPARLTDINERLRILSELGVDRTAVITFSPELAQLHAPDFIATLTSRYQIVEIWAGEDFAFGYRREGNTTVLESLGQAHGFRVNVVQRLELHGGRLASSVIRDLMKEGKVREAAVLLGRYPGLIGTVVHGNARGRTLGYPTANLQITPAQLVPRTGIYAGLARLGTQSFDAAISVGYNPTFGANPLSVETYILDFNRDIFGQQLTLEFVERLRDEQYFDSVDALVTQMGDDVATVRSLLAQRSAS